MQYLRAIAALMVAYFHLIGQIPAYATALSGRHLIRTAALSSGVHIFFVISGFVMYLTAIDSKPLGFAWRRIARIVPLYWILTCLVATVAIAAPRLLHGTDYSPIYLLKSLLFIPYSNPSQQGQLFPMLVPGWSLNYEMFFYGLFALVLFAPLKWRLPIILLLLGVLWEVGRAIGSSERNAVYTSPLVILFAFGLGLGWAYRRWLLRAPLGVGMAVVSVGFVVLIGPWEFGWMSDFVASGAIVMGTLCMDLSGSIPKLSWLALLGDTSYSLYLGHLFVFGFIRALWMRLCPHQSATWGAPLFGVIAMAGAIAFSLIAYRCVERPVLSLMTRKRSTPRLAQLQMPQARA